MPASLSALARAGDMWPIDAQRLRLVFSATSRAPARRDPRALRSRCDPRSRRASEPAHGLSGAACWGNLFLVMAIRSLPLPSDVMRVRRYGPRRTSPGATRYPIPDKCRDLQLRRHSVESSLHHAQPCIPAGRKRMSQPTSSSRPRRARRAVRDEAYTGPADVYREKWSWDKVAWGTHCVDCYPGNCPFKVYVRDGMVWREEQAGKFEQIESGVPDNNPMGCQKGAAWSQQLYSP